MSHRCIHQTRNIGGNEGKSTRPPPQRIRKEWWNAQHNTLAYLNSGIQKRWQFMSSERRDILLFISQFAAMTLIWGAPPSGRIGRWHQPKRRIPAMVGCRDKWRWEVLGAQVFNLSVTVNNLGRRRFIAPLSKCFRRVRVLWPSYWSNWEDVQPSGRNSSEPHRMHAVRKASGALLD